MTEFGEIVESLQPETLLDMYCGVGVFAIVGASAGAMYVEGCEIDAAAIASARINADSFGLQKSCHFTIGDAAKQFRRLGSKGAPDGTMLVLDPPRGGLSPKIVEEVLSLKASHLVYVSCSADSLCRDLKMLLAGGYCLKHARLFDMFPSTAHFETLTLLEKI